ncbi:MAG: phytoene/squalene synthase family protein [Stappiaceae bacterium]
MTDPFVHCQELVRNHDKDRFLTGLFADENDRAGLFALYAFNLEVSRIREKVSDALPGEVRLQWWRDALSGTEHGSVSDHPVAHAFVRTIEKYDLPETAIANLLEARCFDLYDDPMPDMNTLEGYLGETGSIIFQLASMILTHTRAATLADTCGHAGVSYAMVNLLRALPWHSRRNQLYIPADVLSRNNTEAQAFFSLEAGKPVDSVLDEMRAHTRHHLSAFKERLADVPRQAIPAFLPLCLVEPYLKQMEAGTYQPFHSQIDLGPLRRQYIIWKSARKARKITAT